MNGYIKKLSKAFEYEKAFKNERERLSFEMPCFTIAPILDSTSSQLRFKINLGGDFTFFTTENMKQLRDWLSNVVFQEESI